MNITDIYPMDAIETLALQQATKNKIAHFVYAVNAKDENKKNVLIAIDFSLSAANSVYITDNETLVIQLSGNAPVQQTRYTEKDVQRINRQRIEKEKAGSETKKIPKKHKIIKSKHHKKGKKSRRIL